MHNSEVKTKFDRQGRLVSCIVGICDECKHEIDVCEENCMKYGYIQEQNTGKTYCAYPKECCRPKCVHCNKKIPFGVRFGIDVIIFLEDYTRTVLGFAHKTCQEKSKSVETQTP